MEERIHGWMGGWSYWSIGWTERRMVHRLDRYKDGWCEGLDRETDDGPIDGSMDGGMDWIDGRKDGWMVIGWVR